MREPDVTTCAAGCGRVWPGVVPALPCARKNPTGSDAGGVPFRSGGRIRTYDLWVMSPASYRAAPPRAACRSALGPEFQPLAVSDLYSVTQTHPNVKSAGERPFLGRGPPVACMTPPPRACSAHRVRAPRSPCRSPRVTNAPLGTAPTRSVSDWQRRVSAHPLMSATGSVRSKSGRILTPHCQ